MFAGHDTTSHAISWTIWCLATNVDKQEQLYQELIDHFGQSDAEFCTNKLKELKFLDAVIKGLCILEALEILRDLKTLDYLVLESLRCYPPVPFIGRRLQNEVQIGEHRLPKGTSVVIPQAFLHHDEKVCIDY